MIELLRTRRSVRKFAEQTIEPEKIELLKEAVLRAPTSKHSRAWDFIFIDQPEQIAVVAACKPEGAGPISTARLAVVVTVDELKTGAWIEDGSIAAAILQIAAHSLGLGSCWVQVRGREYSPEKSSEGYLQEALGIPATNRVLCVVAIGYPAREYPGRSFDELDFSKIHTNKF